MGEAVDGITLLDGVMMGTLLCLSDDAPVGIASGEFETGVETPFSGIRVETTVLKVPDPLFKP